MKRLFDFTAAFVGVMLLLPLMLLIALLVRITSRGPVLFTQQRIGRHGTPFTCIKFRTMTVGADKEGSVTTAADQRITRIGRFLRRFKLDELPQLWNVVIGRMSFVGPRPDVPGYADRLRGDDQRILELRPGITGPATLVFRDEEQLLAMAKNPKRFNDEVIWPEKVRINRQYVDTQSFWRDIGYILATVLPPLARRCGIDHKLGLRDDAFVARMHHHLSQ